MKTFRHDGGRGQTSGRRYLHLSNVLPVITPPTLQVIFTNQSAANGLKGSNRKKTRERQQHVTMTTAADQCNHLSRHVLFNI